MMDEVQRALGELLAGGETIREQLRGMWALSAINQADESLLISILAHDNEHLRAWALRLLTDRQPPSPAAETQIVALAQRESSPFVRLYLASALQCVSQPMAWELAGVLASRSDDADDPAIPLMIWYGIEPLVPQDPDRALQLIRTSELPLIRQFITRRLAEAM